MNFDNNTLYFWYNSNVKAPLNLAIEEALLNSDFTKEHAVFMLWQNAPSVIIGKHQNAFEEVDLPFLQENSIDLVRRASGGGAVYHDLGNLNYTFILPNSLGKIEFATVLNPMVEALQTLGINAKLSGRNDILALDTQGNEKKISGAAQNKAKHATLIHGTLMIDVNLDILGHVLAGNPDKYTSKGIASVRSRVANIKDLLSPELIHNSCLELVKNTLIQYFINSTTEEKALPLKVQNYIYTKAQSIANERYNNEAWNFKKHQPFQFSCRKKLPFGSIRVNYNVENALITNCTLEGDFFALQDISLLESKFHNIKYDSKEINKTLQSFEIADFILNAPKKSNPEYREIETLFSSI